MYITYIHICAHTRIHARIHRTGRSRYVSWESPARWRCVFARASARGNRAAARKVERATCRESRSRKLDFPKAHSFALLVLPRPSVPLFSPSPPLSLFLSTSKLVCNSREDDPQFSARVHPVLRSSIISATQLYDVCTCASFVVCMCNAYTLGPPFVIYGVRKFRGMDAGPRHVRWRNDISCRKFVG